MENNTQIEFKTPITLSPEKKAAQTVLKLQNLKLSDLISGSTPTKTETNLQTPRTNEQPDLMTRLSNGDNIKEQSVLPNIAKRTESKEENKQNDMKPDTAQTSEDAQKTRKERLAKGYERKGKVTYSTHYDENRVKALQKELKTLDLNTNIEVTGKMDANTRNAIKKLQENLNNELGLNHDTYELKKDGIIGEKTLSTLEEAGEKYASLLELIPEAIKAQKAEKIETKEAKQQKTNDKETKDKNIESDKTTPFSPEKAVAKITEIATETVKILEDNPLGTATGLGLLSDNARNTKKLAARALQANNNLETAKTAVTKAKTAAAQALERAAAAESTVSSTASEKLKALQEKAAKEAIDEVTRANNAVKTAGTAVTKAETAAAKAAKAGKFIKGVPWLSTAITVGTAGYEGYAAHEDYEKGLITEKEKYRKYGESAGSASGALLGGMAGAAMFSFIPFVGTIIGGVGGAILGAMYGGEYGGEFGGKFGTNDKKHKP